MPYDSYIDLLFPPVSEYICCLCRFAFVCLVKCNYRQRLLRSTLFPIRTSLNVLMIETLSATYHVTSLYFHRMPRKPAIFIDYLRT